MHLSDKKIRAIIVENHTIRDINNPPSTLHAAYVNEQTTGLRFADLDLNNSRQHHLVAHEGLTRYSLPNGHHHLKLQTSTPQRIPLIHCKIYGRLMPLQQIVTIQINQTHLSINSTVVPTHLDTGSPIYLISYETVDVAEYAQDICPSKDMSQFKDDQNKPIPKVGQVRLVT